MPSAGGSNSGDGVSLGAASFANGGHYSNVYANFGDLASQANASAEALTNVNGAASEGFSLDTLAAAIDNAYNILPETLEVSVTSVNDNRVVGNTDESVSRHIDVGDNILEHSASERTGLHITNDNAPTLVGKATANSTISVFDGEGENAPLLGTTTADSDGNWSYTPTSPLADGDHKFTIEASKTAVNGEELKATSTQEITVDTVNNQLTIDSISTDQFADLTKFNMFRTPNSETSHIDDSVLVNSWSDVDFKPTVSGKAEAFADVRIEVWMKPAIWELDTAVDKLIGSYTGKADANGNWAIEDVDFHGKSYLDHEYEIKAVSSVDEAGNTYEAAGMTFHLPVPTPPEDHL